MGLKKNLSFSFQVIEEQEEGLKVSFMQEVEPNFFVHPVVDDISFPVYASEVVPIENPIADTSKRRFGYRFKRNIKEEVMGVLRNKDTCLAKYTEA